MRSITAIAAASFLLLGLSSSAMAQRDAADRADRGQRLDLDAFRNDMLQRQMRPPAPAPMLQSAPPSSEQKKPKSSKRGNKPNP